jgi:hypothetical protein
VVVETPNATEERPEASGTARLRRATTTRTVRLNVKTVGRRYTL